MFVENLKKATLMLLPGIQETFKRKLGLEEEILMNISDMIMNIYTLESTLIRVQKLDENNLKTNIALYKDILNVLIHEITFKIKKSGIDAISSFAEGGKLDEYVNALETLTKLTPLNSKEARRRIADKLIDDAVYKF